MTMKPSKRHSPPTPPPATNNGANRLLQTSGCHLTLHPNRCRPRWCLMRPLRLPLLLALVALLAASALAEQQVSTPEQKPALAADADQVAPKSSSEDQMAPAAAGNLADPSAEASGKPKSSSGETMMIAESRSADASTSQQASSSETSSQAQDATQQTKSNEPSRVEPQQQQQQAEEAAVPTVSGLAGQDDSLATVTQQTTTGASAQQQQFLETDQQQTDIVTTSSSNMQQTIDGPVTGSVLEAVRGAAETMNDVMPLTEHFGRKSASEQQQSDGAKPSTASQGGSKGKIRSLKRAFSGHMGVFGRKRTQSGSQAEQTAAAAASAEEQQQMGFEPVAAKPATYHPRPHHHHYYYQHQPQPDYDTPVSTASPYERSSSTRTKLKEADFPDYREILIQPDRAEMGFRPSSFEAARESARANSQLSTVADSQAEQQGVFEQQGHIQVNENDFTEQPEVRQQVETTTFTTTLESNNNKTNSESQVLNSGGPFIRLSNIATINSSSSGADGPHGGNGSANGVKLMRIYVIDLDQKLVVGSNNQQQQQQDSDDKSGIRFALPEAAGQAHAGDYNSTQHQQHASYSNGSAHQQPNYAEQSPQATPQLPDGYVLLDRDSLRANLSQMFALKLAPQTSADHNYSQSNYLPSPGRAQYSQPQQQQQQQPVYQPQPQYQLAADTPTSSVWFSAGYPATGHNASAQVSGSADQYLQPASYGSRGSNYTGQDAGYGQGAHLAANHNNVATYADQQQQVQVQVHHQSVPQYIAPQYRPTAGGPSKPTGDGYAGVANEWSQPAPQPQQPQYRPQGAVQLSSAPELHSAPSPGHPAAAQSPSAPEQVRYNHHQSYNNNYTSKPTLFVQAPVSRQQDKHHANGSHLNVYHHQQPEQQQQPGPMMYQQAQQQQAEQQVVILNPTPVYSTQAQSALAAASAYTAQAARAEPAPTSYYKQHNNEQAHKVTTGSEQSWRPVDYSAPLVAYSQTQPSGQLQSPSSSISPAQYTNNRGAINGYRDHDVVSLAGRPMQAPAGHQQQRQVDSPGQVELESPANVSLAYDGQHAPLNYQQQQQPRKSYPGAGANKQAAYVNTQTDDQQQQQPSVGSTQHQLDTLSSSDPVYAQTGANDGPSQQVLPTSSSPAAAHPSFAGPVQMGHQYNGTGQRHAWPAAGEAQPVANDYQYAGTNEYPSPKGLSKQPPTYAGQQVEADEQEQYGSNPLAAYGSQQSPLTGAKQPIKFSASAPDQSFTHEAPKIPQANSSGYRQQHKPASAYLAVNGPPVADGVYSSDESAGSAKQTRPSGGNRYRASAAKPSGQVRGKQAKRPNYPNGGKLQDSSAYSDQQESIYQQHELASGEPLAGQQTADEYGAAGNVQPASYYGAPSSAHYGGHSRPNSYPPQAGHQPQPYPARPPMVAVANYYRPSPQASKGLLSWETLQSVASGAAKRLPSLSSILMPFSSAIPLPVKGTLYPTANYAGHQPYHYRYNHHHQHPGPAQYPKSAHFDRDVANFHRPYPLRHMQAQPSNGYQDAPSSSDQHPTKHYSAEAPEQHQQQHQTSEPEAASQAEGDHQAGDSYSADLSQASSGTSSEHSPGTSASNQEEAGAQEHPESVDEAVAQELSQSQGASHGTRHAPLPNISILSMQDDEAGSKPALDVIEFAPEDATFGPAGSGKAQSRPRQVKTSPKSGHPKSAKLGQAKSTATTTTAEQVESLDPAQVAVLSSIEQQLSPAGKSGKRKPTSQAKRNKSIPTLASGSSPDAVAAAAAAAAASTDFLEPTILAEHGGAHNAPVPLESLPVDQQRLLMSNSAKRPYFGAPASNIVFPPGADEQPPMSFNGVGGGDPRRPLRPMNSMQIGQFKITPQTQFVQSIIEPSRQMFGQYFQKYIGQLGQTLG